MLSLNRNRDGCQANARAVCVIQLKSMADSRTERLLLKVPTAITLWLAAEKHICSIQLSLISASFPLNERHPRIVATQKTRSEKNSCRVSVQRNNYGIYSTKSASIGVTHSYSSHHLLGN